MGKYLSTVLMVVLCACSDSGGGGGGGAAAGTVDGTINGETISIMSAASSAVTGNGVTAGVILMSNDPDVCAEAGSDTFHANDDVIELIVSNVGSSSETAPTAPGTFTIDTGGSGMGPLAGFFGGNIGSDCAGSALAQGSSGTVTLTGAANGVYSGTFDVTLDSGDHVTGTFSSTSCPALQTFTTSQSAPGCD